MLQSYTIYNRAGGQAKSICTRDLAAAHAEMGDKVLIVDMDAQKGSVTNCYDIDYNKNDGTIDRLPLHMIKRPGGDFEDLIHNAEPGVDIIPRHEDLNDLEEMLDDLERIEKRSTESEHFDRHAQLFRVLKENNIPEKYDVLICDPNAKADEGYYSSLYATRNILIPVETKEKGVSSIEDVFDTASNFADAKEITIGNLGVLATRANLGKGTQEDMAKTIRDEYDGVCYFKDLSIFDDAEKAQESMFAHIKGKSRVRSSQEDILPKYRTLLAQIKQKLGQPLTQAELDSEEFWHGDDFWGEVTPAGANKNKVEA